MHVLYFQSNLSKGIPYLFSCNSSWLISWGWLTSLGNVTIISTPIKTHDSRRKKKVMNSRGKPGMEYLTFGHLAHVFLIITKWTLTRDWGLAIFVSFHLLNKCLLIEQKKCITKLSRSKIILWWVVFPPSMEKTRPPSAKCNWSHLPHRTAVRIKWDHLCCPKGTCSYLSFHHLLIPGNDSQYNP